MNTPDGNPMTAVRKIGYLENRVSDLYHHFARIAPGVQLREEGLIADLWAELDFLYLVDSSNNAAGSA